MEKWKKLDTIKFNGNMYVCYINEQCRVFYLKTDEKGELKYPTLEEYLDLINEFNYRQCIRAIPKKLNFLSSFEPKVYVKNKLMPLALALSLMIPSIGFANADLNQYAKNGVHLKQMDQIGNLYEVESVDTESITEEIYGLRPELFMGMSYKKTCTPIEFSKYTGDKKIEWEDVKNTLEESNIDNKIKDIIKEGINNLQKEGFNYDLTVLNYNLKNLKIVEIDNKELEDQNAGAVFKENGSIVEIPNKGFNLDDKTSKITLQHEILGHGSTIAYLPNEVYCTVDQTFLNIDENGNLYSTGRMGDFASESIADIISIYASDTKITSEHGGYPTEIYALSTLCTSTDCTYEEFINYGIKHLMNKIKENGISNPSQLITTLDCEHNYIRKGVSLGTDKIYNDIFLEYFCESALNKLKKGEKIEDITNVIEESLEEYNNLMETEELFGAKCITQPSIDNVSIIKPDIIKKNVLNAIEYVKNYNLKSMDDITEVNEESSLNISKEGIDIKRFAKKAFAKDDEILGQDYEDVAKMIRKRFRSN